MIGTILLWGAIASFALAAVLAVLVGVGIWHAHRVSEEEQLLAPRPVTVA